MATTLTGRVSARRRPGLLRDALRGALLGDFAVELGVAGALTQALLGYVPVVGTLCAVRDGVGCWRCHDRAGVLLNILALVPFYGGLAKTIDVVRAAHRVGGALIASRRR